MKRLTRVAQGLTGRFLAYALIIGMVPLLAFGFFLTNAASRVLKEQIDNYHADIMAEKKMFLIHTLGDVENLIDNLSGNEEIRSVLAQETNEGSAYQRLVTQAKMGYILSGYTNLNGMVGIDLFSVNNVHYHVGETLDIGNTNMELKDRLFREALRSKDNVYWSGIERNINLNSSREFVIHAVKPLRIGKNNNQGPQWFLIVSYDMNYFDDSFKFWHGPGYYIVFDDKNDIIYHPDKKYVGQKLADRLSSKFGASEGKFVDTIDGEDFSINYAKIPETGWVIASFTPLSVVYRQTDYILFVLVLALLACLFMAAFFVVFVSRRIVEPIKRVTDTFKALQDGDIGDAKKLDVRTNDEIGHLGSLFNSFIDARKDILVQKELEKKLNERNTELQKAMSELQQTQGQLVQQEKLAAIGQLAAGVAHEINNPMGFIISNLGSLEGYNRRILDYIKSQEEALSKLESDKSNIEDEQKRTAIFAEIKKAKQKYKIDYIMSDAQALIQETLGGAGRVKNIVQDLKGFARVADEVKPADINEGLNSTINIIWNELKYKATLIKELGDIPQTICNIGQLNQVFMNVLVNAVQAIPEQGEIRVKTFVDQANIIITIADNGNGMPPEVLKRIFEPFYTTKEVGKGTGLGLSVSYDIIKNHGGSIQVESEVGKGTIFTITIPVKCG